MTGLEPATQIFGHGDTYHGLMKKLFRIRFLGLTLPLPCILSLFGFEPVEIGAR